MNLENSLKKADNEGINPGINTSAHFSNKSNSRVNSGKNKRNTSNYGVNGGNNKRHKNKIPKNTPLPKEFVIKTRYRGSKNKVLPLIYNTQLNLKYNSVLDLFGGTGSVSYLFKRLNKKVIYNDHLKFNHIIGRALIENSKERLSSKDVSIILKHKEYDEYPHVIENNFKDIYYIDEENRWLDQTIFNIYQMKPGYKQDMAFWCLFQSCIIKRPFSLFHRKNLNLRLNDVKRTFGNKKTWDTPFEVHYKNFVKEINSYIYDSPAKCRAVSEDVLKLDISKYIEPSLSEIKAAGIDLVYIDPPYIPENGENIKYRNIYHFLEGIADYNNWEAMIDLKSKHRRLIPVYNPWNDKYKVEQLFMKLIEKYSNSMIMISHRSDGIPAIDTLISILKEFGKTIRVVDEIDHKYALSSRKSKEVLILGV